MSHEDFTRLEEIKSEMRDRLEAPGATNQHMFNQLILEAIGLITSELIALEGDISSVLPDND